MRCVHPELVLVLAVSLALGVAVAAAITSIVGPSGPPILTAAVIVSLVICGWLWWGLRGRRLDIARPGALRLVGWALESWVWGSACALLAAVPWSMNSVVTGDSINLLFIATSVLGTPFLVVWLFWTSIPLIPTLSPLVMACWLGALWLRRRPATRRPA